MLVGNTALPPFPLFRMPLHIHTLLDNHIVMAVYNEVGIFYALPRNLASSCFSFCFAVNGGLCSCIQEVSYM